MQIVEKYIEHHKYIASFCFLKQLVRRFFQLIYTASFMSLRQCWQYWAAYQRQTTLIFHLPKYYC